MEILKIFQYDRRNFVTLERITVHDMSQSCKEVIIDTFKPDQLQILDKKGNEILCVMKHHNDRGFWPAFMSDQWTILPPLILDSQYIYETLLIKENFEAVFKEYSSIIGKLEIIAINEVKGLSGLIDFHDSSHILNYQPTPHFSERQREISIYATRRGYYEIPKKVSAEKIASKFGISISAVNFHLRKAERTAMQYFFG